MDHLLLLVQFLVSVAQDKSFKGKFIEMGSFY